MFNGRLTATSVFPISVHFEFAFYLCLPKLICRFNKWTTAPRSIRYNATETFSHNLYFAPCFLIRFHRMQTFAANKIYFQMLFFIPLPFTVNRKLWRWMCDRRNSIIVPRLRTNEHAERWERPSGQWTKSINIIFLWLLLWMVLARARFTFLSEGTLLNEL